MENASATLDGLHRRFLIVTLGAKDRTSSHLFDELSRFLARDHSCRSIWIGLPDASLAKRLFAVFASNFRHLRDVPWSQVVIVHAPTALSLPLLIMARILGRRLIVFQWDIYPISINGVPFRNSLPRRLLNWLEGRCLKMADVVVLPSEDFREFSLASNPVIFPLWPQSTLQCQPVQAVPSPDGVYHIAFAGEINELRGLRECFAHLQARSQNPIVVHLFSDHALDWVLDANEMLRVEHHGRLPREMLQTRLRQMHFGLISLHPLLNQPGFPSKTFDYLAAGLPVLYFGRPLPAYTRQLEDCGIGADISNADEISLKQLYDAMILQMEQGRVGYLAHTQLNRERVGSLLQLRVKKQA